MCNSSTLVARVTELEVTLKVEEKYYQDASNTNTEKTRQAEEDKKTSLYESKAHANALNTLEHEVISMNMTLHDFVQRTMQVMLSVRDQVVDQTKRFIFVVEIPVQELNPFLGMLLRGFKIVFLV